MGSLTADLLHFQPGHYVVRAMVQVEGITLATGLSAAATLEQAEDLARARALVVLGIELAPYEAQAHLLDAPRDLPQQPTAQLNPARAQGDQMPLLEQPYTQDSATDWGPRESFPESSPTWGNGMSQTGDAFESPAPPDSGPPVQQAKSSANGTRRRSPKSTNGPPPAKASRRSKAVAPEPEVAPTPVDLSDIIAQSDVELKRLGWTNAQGRRYLEQTYNKRSRQQLTDEELLEFLHYLQSQSLSEEPPF